ncbi:MAG: 30S ribosomal protein S9 [Ignavibacteriales bacterium]|nr:MAG: 30S ribosomal protein S9 [Ignavibacteriaceae bacterium]MBW7874301.1 30S ribosomal protein S9 [Ignavibacteria bacterium]MCZ2143218.1 30S ribosomal protein S9 [Ignavibacteriales bacterium]OQY72143.1 MAG: 30S ribosomal protein S9 [Ignavibacteriales bacterium UTCHB3]MBV6444098.1 30S ribosomal protein S9 [Ignavibacteriaceae bacterium]
MSDTLFVGRRKTAVARVVLRPGEGKVTINGRELKTYFAQKTQQDDVVAPFEKLELAGRYDVFANVQGGGPSGQAEAVRLAIARALTAENEEYKSPLKQEGYLRRDPRMVERKKYGRPKARKRFQFSKR